VFSIAQLYNHLEGEISGFSKTDRFNTEENAWRDKTQVQQGFSLSCALHFHPNTVE
jgi:hypothetical protein